LDFGSLAHRADHGDSRDWLAFLAFATASIRVRIENLNRLSLRHVLAIQIGVIDVVGLLLAALRGIEAAV
jgi:hypothetical protein